MMHTDKTWMAVALVGVGLVAMTGFWWFDGLSRAAAREAAAAAGAAPRVLTPSAPVVSRPAAWAMPPANSASRGGEVGGAPTEAWLMAERNEIDLGWLIHQAASHVRTDRLLRNRMLNPHDQQLSFAVIDRLQQVLDERQPQLRQASRELSLLVSQTLSELKQQGGGTALTIDLVPAAQRQQFLVDAWQHYQTVLDPEFRALEERRASALRHYLVVKAPELVPGTVQRFTSRGVDYAVTLAELGDGVCDAAAAVAAQKRELLVAVMQWALDEGLTAEPYLVGVLGQFDELAAAGPYARR